MKASVEVITPLLAAQLLEVGGANRNLSNLTVARYAADMAAGRWKVNGEPVILAETGRLLDGQHRLQAIVTCNKAIQMAVVRGVPESVFNTIDQGRSRDARDVLAINGEKYVPALTAGARLVWDFEHDFSTYDLRRTSQGNKAVRSLTVQEIEAVVEAHPTLREFASAVYNERKDVTAILTAGLATGMWRILEISGGRARADEFMERVALGAGMEWGHPILMFRNATLGMKGTKGISNKHQKKAVLAMAFKAWNAWIEKRDVGMIRFRPTYEDFPSIKKVA